MPNHLEAFGPDGKSLDVVFQTATPFETLGWTKELVNWFNASVSEETRHPLILIGIFIVAFPANHPFKDGNGGLSRVLTTLLLLRAGYGYVPYSSMERVYRGKQRQLLPGVAAHPADHPQREVEPGILARVFPENDGQAKEQPCGKGRRDRPYVDLYRGFLVKYWSSPKRGESSPSKKSRNQRGRTATRSRFTCEDRQPTTPWFKSRYTLK